MTIGSRKIVILAELGNVVHHRRDMTVHCVDVHTQMTSCRGSIGQGKEEGSGNCKSEPLHFEWFSTEILEQR